MEEVEFSETEFERYGKLLERKNKTIEEVVRGLGLPEEVEKLANELFKRYKMSGKRACVSTIIASVALASRIYGFAIPFRKIIEEVGVKVSRRALLRSLSSMRMGSGVEWDSYLNYALMKVGRDLPPLVRERLMVNAKKEMVRILRKRELVLGRNPIQIVAVAIYFAARRIGLRISMREIACNLGVSESSVYRVKGLIEDG